MLERYVYKNNQTLRLGYTTGSCAAAAAKAAARMLLSGEPAAEVELMTPKGIALHLEVLDACLSPVEACCGIRKDAGDDPDVTDGLTVYARVRKIRKPEIAIDGGEGVGRVTRPGLEQPVGSAAINRVPRQMIREGVEKICARFGKGVLREVPEADFFAALPELRRECGDRAVLRAVHIYDENRRVS